MFSVYWWPDFCPVNALLSETVSYCIIPYCITYSSSQMTTNFFIRPDKEKCFNLTVAPVTWHLFYFRKQCGVNVSSASDCYDWPGVDVLHHRILNSYVLIPVIFLLRSHTAEFWKFTGNITTSHNGKLPERTYRYFWKDPVHTWSLYGNLPEILGKSLHVWKGLMSLLIWVYLIWSTWSKYSKNSYIVKY